MNYAVIVVTCNRVKLLEECVNAILSQSKPVNQVIIVDNDSKDGTEAYLATIDDKRFKVIRSPSNLGGAGGFALAMSAVDLDDNDFVLIIDDDAIIQKEFVSEIEKKMSSDILAYSGTVMEEGKPAVFHRKRITRKNILGDAVSPEEYEKDTFLYDIGSFCGLFVATSLIRQVGLPKSEFFIWHDDTEYCLRFHTLTEILNVNRSILVHKRLPSQSSVDNWRNFYGTRNQLWLLKKYRYRQYLKERIKLKLKIRNVSGSVRKMYSDAIRQAKRNQFGINEKYLPELNRRKENQK